VKDPRAVPAFFQGFLARAPKERDAAGEDKGEALVHGGRA
jgi:hypothetical protein